MTLTFVSAEKLGILFQRVQQLATHERKKDRAAEVKFLDNTLRRLGLIPSGPQWSTVAIAVGCDRSGNLGAFISQEAVTMEPNP